MTITHLQQDLLSSSHCCANSSCAGCKGESVFTEEVEWCHYRYLPSRSCRNELPTSLPLPSERHRIPRSPAWDAPPLLQPIECGVASIQFLIRMMRWNGTLSDGALSALPEPYIVTERRWSASVSLVIPFKGPPNFPRRKWYVSRRPGLIPN